MDRTTHLACIERWKTTVEEARSSGIGIRNWCRENEISVSQYYYWHKVLIDEGVLPKKHGSSGSFSPESPSAALSVPLFAEIDLCRDTAPQMAGGMPVSRILESQIIIQRNNCQIFVGEGFSSTTLGRILEVISNAP